MLLENILKTTESQHREIEHFKLKKIAWVVLSQSRISVRLIGHYKQIFTTPRIEDWNQMFIMQRSLKNINLLQIFPYPKYVQLFGIYKCMQTLSHKNILWDVP